MGDSATATYDRTLPVLSINRPITSDDAINSLEQDDVPVSGLGEPGANVTVTITDSTGASVTQTVTVDENGEWSVSDLSVSSLQPGTLSVVASETVDGTTVVSEHNI